MAFSLQCAVVLLHGLPPDDPDPFADLRPLEAYFLSQGFSSLEFRWPPAFNGALALASRKRSFSRELAEHLDVYLRSTVIGGLSNGEWIVLGHSGGGLTFFRWLLDYSANFFADGGSPPAIALLFAAPYKCDEQQIPLPDGRMLPVHEDPLPADLIADRLPGKLVLFSSPSDEMILPQDSLFPSPPILASKVHQYLIHGATHRDICQHTLSRLLVDYYVTLLRISPENGLSPGLS